MILKYGDYSHPSGTVALAIMRSTALTASGIPYMTQARWGVEGTILADSALTDASALQADLTTKIQALETAYKQLGADLLLTDDNGTATAHVIRNSETIGGIRVIEPPHYPYGSGAEYVNYRRFRVGLEADLIVSGDAPIYLTFQETLTTSGGGPGYAWTSPIGGLPQRQIVRQNLTYRAVQSGFAVGFKSYPTAPPPLFPGSLVQSPDIAITSPQRRGSDFMSFGIQWQYVYESNQPMFGVPNSQPFI